MKTSAVSAGRLTEIIVEWQMTYLATTGATSVATYIIVLPASAQSGIILASWRPISDVAAS